MKFKRMMASLLVVATLCGLCVALPASAANVGFSDIADAPTAQAAETLRLLGIVGGDGGGNFYPGHSLTRGEFCKMAVNALGKGDEAAAQMNRTIFGDVRGDHWARGYINLAASTSLGGSTDSSGATTGGDKLMMGLGDGNFYPNRTITYAEAVTILMRILGYSSKDVTAGATWYDGYLAMADAVRLTDGVALHYSDQITRGQTAILFENMLFTAPRGGKDPYFTTPALGGTLVKESVILSLSATTDDGVAGAVLVTGNAAPYKTDHAPFPAALEGCRAQLLLDKHDKVVAIQPSTVGTHRVVSVVSAEATYLTAPGGEKLEVAPATPAYKDGVATTYKDIYLNLKPSALVSFHYNATGKLEYVFLPTSDVAQTAAVATSDGGSSFSSLLGKASDYRVVKNGLPASIGDVRRYDVATYDKAGKTLYVSDLRITGVYENVAPSPATPTSVTVLGATFPVLSSAYSDLADFKIGSTITLLLTSDGQVAGAVPPSSARSTTVGVVKMDGTTATVTPLADLRDASGKKITLVGETTLTAESAAKLQGQLVTVSSDRVNRLNLSRLTGSGASGDLNVTARTLGGAPLADNVFLYERVGNSVPARISFAQLTRRSVPASKISYVSTDYAGRVNIIVFDDVTGDQYTYGLCKTDVVTDYAGGGSSSNSVVFVEYATGKTSPPLVSGAAVEKDSFIGVSPSLNKVGNLARLGGWVPLKSIAKVSRTSFDVDSSAAAPDPIGTVTANGMTFPISGDVVCYNKNTKKWFATLDDARAYSESLTVYYDRAPQEGGKIRLVVVE